MLPESVLAELAEADALILGAVGAAPGSKAIPSGLLERGLLLKLRRYDAVLAQKVGYTLADDGRFDGAVLFPKRRAMQVTGSRRRPQIKA